MTEDLDKKKSERSLRPPNPFEMLLAPLLAPYELRAAVKDVSQIQKRAVDQVANADPRNIQEVAASQQEIINSYYEAGLRQSQQSFGWSLIWGGVGFGFLIAAVAVLLYRQPTEIALASVIAGALVEVFAGIYLYLYKHTSDQLAEFRIGLESTQWLLLSNSMCERLEGEWEQTTRAELIRLTASSAVNNQMFSLFNISSKNNRNYSDTPPVQTAPGLKRFYH